MDPIFRAAAKSWPNFRSKFPSVTSLSWQFLNRTKGNLKVKNSSSLIYHYAHFLLYGRGVGVEGGGGGENKNSTWSQPREVERKGKRSVGKRKYTIIIRIYNNYISNKTKRNYDYKNRKNGIEPRTSYFSRGRLTTRGL